MATSSTKKLTKYTSGSTIVTADTANAWYGGLYGSYEGTLLDVDDPRVIGHVHDGEPYDGHAGKINLVNHVTDKLLHQNLSDQAVWKNNVGSFLTRGEAIPESVVIDSVKYYYLDLTDIYTYVDDEITLAASPFEEADSNADTVDDVVRQSNYDYTSTGLDFVFASEKLDDMNDASKGDNRFLFDRSKGAFRAGSVNSTQWNNANRGDYSFAAGRNTTASGNGSFAAGVGNIASGDNSFVGGSNNQSQSPGTFIAGANNTAFVGSSGSVITGVLNAANSPNSLIFGKESVGNIDGEFCHSSGKFTTLGDAQTSEYTVRGSLIGPFAPPGLILNVDGIGKNYQMDIHAAYHVSVMLIGKLAGPSQEAGVYKLEALAIGPTTTPAGGVITSILTTYISRTSYFLSGPPYVNATLTISPGTNNLQINVSDTHPAGFIPSRWVATVTLTKCKF